MSTDFTASAVSAGALISTATFEVPPFQREYAWARDEYEEFWDDVQRSLRDQSYFLGLVILTGKGTGRRQIVDGQQRLLTITLLATALYREARGNGRSALADRIRADFLRTIDFQTDAITPRILLADDVDNQTLQRIIDDEPLDRRLLPVGGEDLSTRMLEAFEFLSNKLRDDLAPDPFKRLGVWTEFISGRLEFAVFLHPDPASAYRVFEVINTRGRELTTADLLKNYLLSQTPPDRKEEQYGRWQRISRSLSLAGSNTFVQFIRHVVTVQAGHIPPKELFDYLARRRPAASSPPSPAGLLDLLEENLPLYLQMVDPTVEGPATSDALRVFAALNELNVIAVRPLLLAISRTADAQEGMERVLKLVVRRVVVGTLGTGNVERRLGDAALAVERARGWDEALASLRDLDPQQDEFVAQLARRPLSKALLQFVRRSTVQLTRTPDPIGWLQFIRPRQGGHWEGFDDEDLSYWGPTIGNTVLVSQERRPLGATTWATVRETLLPLAIDSEWTGQIAAHRDWDAAVVAETGRELAEAAAGVWY